MDHLFNRLDGAYPNRWRASFPNGQAIANWRESWAEAFDEAGLSPDDVKAGLRACRGRYDWPPSVAEFIKASRPSIDIDAAVQEAVHQLHRRRQGRDVWSNPALYWAAMQVGEFDMLNLSHAALLKRFAAALDAVAMQGTLPDVPPLRTALPAPGKGCANPERVAAAMRQLRATRKAPGSRGWAERIVARERAGERLAFSVVRMAHTALQAGA